MFGSRALCEHGDLMDLFGRVRPIHEGGYSVFPRDGAAHMLPGTAL